ncbi:MAG: glutamate--tRNA ligase [Verrucomicrobia bacterium 13_2_20CM_54_12]|nr:MAG: glutamate--tRNA ligase [Verrucomicrobia bacterium 13_2_20CM_54_12]OLB44428.1 MAG: glutamate--tRNA ligase [Verrucomicrobia bacterium 13_2_20CM_2_54_15]OLD74353.1 MAG: glutamate--tRNA ligase [Verrucomicrobia bacterium 13_1_20CM_54_28]OLD90109.1 MAG: glutamate--tRNA ligase [Verrucomicrobia bacterium 13_1_20CM_4_54_11]OLE13391.1 MAG: glutamate--tRNA ligase [Verrucomicrobia bacterium 13_1_20CM_3_54_17]PYK15508.1 MAG: glutamate--tRNA ligase [Verrucomicrobiota bacterium]
MSDIRVRFAPSPTGYLHIGGARTGLFNWLFARHHGGKFVLRIEDTDIKRNTEEAMAAIYSGLQWLGLNWDEGPHAGGDYGPYLQSERTELYERYLKKLQDAGHIFEDQGALRFRSPREHVIVDDIVCGKIDFDLTNPATHPDMTIRRPDGSWIFHFVNVIDDLEMKISHVIRGEDHLSNTPKHIEIFRALGATPPHYAHIPLILNRDGSKMSKRDEGARVDYYIRRGFLPAAVRNYLCLLGWSPKDNREKIDIDKVILIFDLKNIGRSSATFDPDKLHWLNGEYTRELNDSEFYDLAVAKLRSSGVKLENFPEKYVRAALETCKGKINTFDELPAYCGFYFTEDFDYNQEGVAKHFTAENKPRLTAVREALSALEKFDAATIEATLKSTAAKLGVKVGGIVHPTRLAVTGSNVGPSLYHLLEVLGKENVIARIDRALAMF